MPRYIIKYLDTRTPLDAKRLQQLISHNDNAKAEGCCYPQALTNNATYRRLTIRYIFRHLTDLAFGERTGPAIMFTACAIRLYLCERLLIESIESLEGQESLGNMYEVEIRKTGKLLCKLARKDYYSTPRHYHEAAPFGNDLNPLILVLFFLPPRDQTFHQSHLLLPTLYAHPPHLFSLLPNRQYPEHR